jgi:hypothetical protein
LNQIVWRFLPQFGERESSIGRPELRHILDFYLDLTVGFCIFLELFDLVVRLVLLLQFDPDDLISNFIKSSLAL